MFNLYILNFLLNAGRVSIPNPRTMQSYVLCLLMVVAAAAAAPQREGASYTKEAIKQAQNTHLIPADAEIQKVSPLRYLLMSQP